MNKPYTLEKAVLDLYNKQKNEVKKKLDTPEYLKKNIGRFYPVNILKKTEEKEIYVITDGKEDRVIKLVPLYKIGNEVDILEKMGNMKIAPRVLSTDVITKNEEMAYIEMERITANMEDLLSYNLDKKDIDILLNLIFNLLFALNKFKVSHGDFHWGNIGFCYDKDKKGIHLKIIDFEFGENESNIKKEILQLIRTIDKKYTPTINQENRSYVKNKLISYYQKKYGVLKDIEDEYKRN